MDLINRSGLKKVCRDDKFYESIYKANLRAIKTRERSLDLHCYNRAGDRKIKLKGRT